MKNNLFTRSEFMAKFEIPETTLREWEKLKLLKPVGYADDQVPLYGGEMTQKACHIRRLQELGYEPEEIQKIIKKVGLPNTARKETKGDDLGKYLTIGNLAERVGLSPRTIKHWEDKGIIEPDMRSEGGFRLYSGAYVYLCELIRDLQLFGYTLVEIKEISDYVRDFLALKVHLAACPKAEAARKLEGMLDKIRVLFEKTELLREGIERWEDLLKKKKKEIFDLKAKNEKRNDNAKEKRR